MFYTFIQVLYFDNKGYDELAKLALNSCETTLNSARPRICNKLLKHNLKLTSQGILWNNPLELKRRSLHWSSLMLSEWVGPNWLRLKGRQGGAQRTEVYCIYWCDQKIIAFIDLTKKLRRMKRQIWQLQKQEQSAKRTKVYCIYWCHQKIKRE